MVLTSSSAGPSVPVQRQGLIDSVQLVPAFPFSGVTETRTYEVKLPPGTTGFRLGIEGQLQYGTPVTFPVTPDTVSAWVAFGAGT